MKKFLAIFLIIFSFAFVACTKTVTEKAPAVDLEKDLQELEELDFDSLDDFDFDIQLNDIEL